MNFLSFFQEVLLGKIKWIKLGRGNYNKVFFTAEKFDIDKLPTQWVCKKPIRKDDEPYPLNDPERACRKWQEINPDFPAYLSPNKHLWFMPYLGTGNASDELTAHAIIDIYRRTGNIIADGGIISNFVKLDNDVVVCVDVDLAVRRNSISSELFFNEVLSSEQFDQFFEGLKKQKRPKTLSCIKVLFFLEDCLAGSEFDRQLMNFELLNYCYTFASNGYVIDSTIYHNLYIISQHSLSDLEPQYIDPLYLSKLPKCENYKELSTHLVNIYENFDEIVVQGDKKDISNEDEVAELLGQLVEQVGKKFVFENLFFANLSKRTFFANSAVEANKDLQLAPGFN